MRLNGWQRLFAITAVVYGGLAAHWASGLVPNGVLLDDEWQLSPSEIWHQRVARGELPSLATAYVSAVYGHRQYFQLLEQHNPYASLMDGNPDNGPWRAKRDTMLRLRGESRRRSLPTIVFVGLVSWLIPLCALYGIGWVTAWVVDGFRRPRLRA